MDWQEKALKIRVLYDLPSKSRNIAIALCTIEGGVFEIYTVSGKLDRPNAVAITDKPIFTPFDYPLGRTRMYDAEYKLLEEIAARYTQDKNITGTIELFTELFMCPSCTHVLGEFKRMYPNIKVNLIELGERL